MHENATHLAELARQIRGETLKLLAAAPDDWLTFAPEGTSNHILWHAGHAVWLQDVLFVEVVTDGQGYSATRVEYQMTRWLSLLSTVSTIGRTSASVRISKDY